VTQFIAIAGVAPGMGKTTVCESLRDWLAGRELDVDLFREEEVLTRPEFAAVAAEFAATGRVGLPTLLAGMSDYVASIQRAGVQTAVADSLVPFVSSLIAWGHDDAAITGFLTDLARLLMPVHPVIIYLDGDPQAGLARAADREGGDWLDWFVGKLARYQVRPPVHDVRTACLYLEAERAITLRLISAQPWHVARIEHADKRSPAEVARRTQDALTPWLIAPRA
jgi:thymidylate kinase